MKKACLVPVLVLLFQTAVFSATYTVGAGKTYATIGAVPVLAAGDVVEIYGGTYNEAKIWGSAGSGTASNPITVRGMGLVKPLIDGTGIDLSGSPDSLFMVYAHDIVFENLEFKNGGKNDGGSGIRIQGSSYNVTIRNCKISYCALGVSSATGPTGIIVEYTEISDCIDLRSDHWGHNVYMNSDSIFRYCYIHDSGKANNFKSRGHYTELWYNYIADANSAEIDFPESAATAAANSNAVLIGNVIIKRTAAPKSGYAGNETQFVFFGQDVGGTRNGTIYMINNTVIAGRTLNIFLELNSSGKAVCYNNVFYGTNNMTKDAYTNTNTSGSNNWIPATATNPTGFTTSTQGADPGFTAPATRDFHLLASGTAVNAGLGAPTYKDGSGVSHSAVPNKEYLNHLKYVTRASDAALDIGAFENGTDTESGGGGGTGGGTTNPFINVKVYPSPFKFADSLDKNVKLVNIPSNAFMEIYDINGSKIRVLTEAASAGNGLPNYIVWDVKNETGNLVPSGTYAYLLQDGAGNKKVGKIALVK